jgi:hypothetical protein
VLFSGPSVPSAKLLPVAKKMIMLKAIHLYFWGMYAEVWEAVSLPSAFSAVSSFPWSSGWAGDPRAPVRASEGSVDRSSFASTDCRFSDKSEGLSRALFKEPAIVLSDTTDGGQALTKGVDNFRARYVSSVNLIRPKIAAASRRYTDIRKTKAEIVRARVMSTHISHGPQGVQISLTE